MMAYLEGNDDEDDDIHDKIKSRINLSYACCT
jgi:hypothetical protein